jgi:Protein of unknown function (DUF1161)
MKSLAAFSVLLFFALSAYAAKPCEELKSEITKKLEAKNVSAFTLDIVAKDKEAEGTVVGTCEGGTKKIVYNRTTQPKTPPPAKNASKP